MNIIITMVAHHPTFTQMFFDKIMPWLVSLISTGISALVVTQLKVLLNKNEELRAKRKEENIKKEKAREAKEERLNELTLGIARLILLDRMEKAIERGYTYDSENTVITKLYRAYRGSGGNTVVEKIYNDQFSKLTIHVNE